MFPKIRMLRLCVDDEKKHKRSISLKVLKSVLNGADAIGKVGTQVASKSEEVFRNKSLMKRQMFLWSGQPHNDGLEKFMNM